jgi:hypothetical protein
VKAGEHKEDWDRAEIEILCCRLDGERIPGQKNLRQLTVKNRTS